MMKKFATALLIAAFTVLTAQAQRVEVEASRGYNGYVAISVDGAVPMSGLNLVSAGGYLVPIPPGTTAANAAPFTFLLANNANNVAYAAIPGSTVRVEGTLLTNVGYTGDGATVDLSRDMFGSTYGNAAFQPVLIGCHKVTHCFPEPSSNILAVTACLCLLGFRRRRSS